MNTTDWNLAQLILAIAAAWIGSGLCAGGLAFASAQKDYDVVAADHYLDHVIWAFWLGVFLGPITLGLAIFQLLRGNWEYRGMLFPGSWTRKDAKQLQRSARRKISRA